ncbi:hypothetical protein [Psychromonas sp.]|uniref:hypothetical protein n=1 Tax=Psychromonas sp. TaxID=1884585 RepID=UPI0035690B81
MMTLECWHSGKPWELYKEDEFKGLTVCNNGIPFVLRSLTQLYEMYCKWVNDKKGFYMIPIELIIPGGKGVCNEAVVNGLFCKIQYEIAEHMPEGDSSIGLAWTTGTANGFCVHRGYLFIKADAFEYARSSEDHNCFFDREFEHLLNSCMASTEKSHGKGVRGSVNYPSDEGGLSYLPGRGDGDEKCQSNFQIISRLAQVQTKGSSTPLFRVRYGFKPEILRQPFEWVSPSTLPPESEHSRGQK